MEAAEEEFAFDDGGEMQFAIRRESMSSSHFRYPPPDQVAHAGKRFVDLTRSQRVDHRSNQQIVV